MAWFRRDRSKSPVGGDLTDRLPPITYPSTTEHLADTARQEMSGRPEDEHWDHIQVLSYLELLQDWRDSPLYRGLSGRAAILLRLSGKMRADLEGLGELIQRKGAHLFLEGHRLGRYGMVRAVLELPEYDLIFETPLSLAHGDAQEFVSAGYHNEAIELHVAHVNDTRSLALVCQTAGIRPVVDAALDAVRGLDHPTTHAEQAGPVAELEARFPGISDGLRSQTRIRLTVTGPADNVVRVVTRN